VLWIGNSFNPVCEVFTFSPPSDHHHEGTEVKEGTLFSAAYKNFWYGLFAVS
jgi:hypothetical protein